jgi:transmembrane sensor
MEGKDNFEELIISFLLEELNEEEETFVIERINSDEQSRQYFEEVKKTLKLVGIKDVFDKVNVDKEWNSFEQALVRKEHPVIFMNEAERFGNEIIKEIKLKRKARIFKSISLTAVAASVILAIGLGLSLFYHHQPARQMVSTSTEEKPAVTKPFIRHLTNRSHAMQHHILQDGTEVLLADNSELSFQEPFEPNKRDIWLKGKASFKVAKDKTKPFTVFSGDISTTALGTNFTITAFENSNRIIVSLHEGKVVVKSRKWANKEGSKAYYMLPGQELVFEKNKPSNQPRVSIVANGPVNEKSSVVNNNTNLSEDQPSIPKYGNGSWFMFNNQSLDNVFDQLSDMYEIEIRYNRKDISKMYFIGTFSKADSLESILKQIALLNNLVLNKENNKFIITK